MESGLSQPFHFQKEREIQHLNAVAIVPNRTAGQGKPQLRFVRPEAEVQKRRSWFLLRAASPERQRNLKTAEAQKPALAVFEHLRE